MKREEKLSFAEKLFKKGNIDCHNISISRDDILDADFFWPTGIRGGFGIIIGDDGSYLHCPSARDYNFWKEKFKTGMRTGKKEE